jgi:Bacterial regulatory proteins, tetR family
MEEKDKIISYSQNIFLKSGFYKITMDEIAKGLGISKKTIYKHFPSKSKLVDAAVSLLQMNLKRKIFKIISEQKNAILKIKALTKFFADLSLTIDEKMLYDLQTQRPDLWEKLDEFRGKIVKDVWTDIINLGKDEKYIVDKPNDIIISVILSSIRGVVNPIFLLNHNYSINEAFKIAFDILIKGILTPMGLEIYNNLEQGNENEKD